MKHVKYIMLLSLYMHACAPSGDKEAGQEIQTDQNTIVLNSLQTKNAGIVLGDMTSTELSGILKVNGKIDVPPQNMVSISVPLGGYLKTSRLLPGMHVKKGDIIAVMQDQQYIQLQQDYLTAKERIVFLEQEFMRQKELNVTKSSSDKVFQQAEASFKTERVLIASLAEKLKLAGISPNQITEHNITSTINIPSPITGFVSKVNVNIGKYVSPTEVLFELINPLNIHLALNVFEKDIHHLFIGQQLKAYSTYDPSEKYHGKILLIGRKISPTGSIDVHCHFENYNSSLVPGTYMLAEIDIRNKQVLALPEDAVLIYGDKKYVFIKTDSNRYRMVEVETGVSENGQVEIVNSEKFLQQQVVIKGAYSLLMSLKNKTVE